ncbi:DUF4232 domain-containing protein [Nocardioides sp. LHD-245]|uniref:DUF4232 domain-containing protein n=1 Tax=Nocardioides sp. LHD-245 TaxID=3051387 RepID=UPI0027E0E42C|nr:DUF4232 domain-containing protein [Nocardioides sp. LHD-245]
MKRLLGSVLLLVAATGCSGAPADPEPRPADDLASLLRTRATAGGPGSCGPEQVAVTLEGYDVALGHRYTRITVRNLSDRPCRLEGAPGIGARGANGSTFEPAVEQANTPAATPVELAPGAAAGSALEWTGELAGADSEHASLLVLQLAADQPPVSVPARLVGDTEETDPLDIGPLTTLRLAPFTALTAEEASRTPRSRDEPVRPEKP